MGRVHLSLAVVALLVLAGCTGGGAAPSTTVETTGETTEETTAKTIDETTAKATTQKAPHTTAVDRSETTSAGTENATLAEKDVFEVYGVAVNYSAGGDLDASAVARSHLAALREIERLTVSSVSQSEVGNRSTVVSSYFERDANRSLFRTNGTGRSTAIYHGQEVSVMKTVQNGEASYMFLGDTNDSASGTGVNTDPASAFVMDLARLQLMPYEKVGTVTRNGTTMTKYEATGPGYYAVAGNASVESFTSTVLVDENGLVRLFHQKVVVERGGETVSKKVTVRYDEVGTATVTEPEWVEAARNETDSDDG